MKNLYVIIGLLLLLLVFYFVQTKETFTVTNFYDVNKNAVNEIKRQIKLYTQQEFVMGAFPPLTDNQYYVSLSNALRKLTPHQKYVAAYWFLDYLQNYKQNDMSFSTFNSFIYCPLIALLELRNNQSRNKKTINVDREVGKLMTIFWRKLN